MLHEDEPTLSRRDAALTVAARAGLFLAGVLFPGLITIRASNATASPAAPSKGTTMTDLPLTSDPYRLPRHVVPTRYDLRLEPDLNTATFTGRATIAVTVTHATTRILLNAIDLTMTSAVLDQDGGKRIEAGITLDTALQRCELQCAEPLAPGTWRLHLDFQGQLNDHLRGFYRSTYKDQTGATKTMAATQFEATDARRAFPCWDEPDFKAVFATTLVIDPALTAVSNTRIQSESLEDGKKVIRFADSMVMSTYLVAFIVGQLEATPPLMVGRTPVRLWTVPGKQGLTAFGHEIAVASLKFFEGYYGIPYPGDKLDLLAIPDFASGAMENLGAITFRETALLVDPHQGTHGELERVADVVAHENAHMWFGDLVTMSWWNGLWLNEAFATFMEMLAVDAWKPEWKRWDAFSVSRAAAFSVDGLQSTRPIEYPVRAPKDADAMFDVLTYEKGASVLRMLEQHIGPTVFRDGVRDYLSRHAYGNADTTDLWVSLGQAARQPVPDLMNGWIFQPGFPLISADLDGPSTLVLSQQRFAYLQDPPASTQSWHVPIRLRMGREGTREERQILLTSPTMRVPLPAGTTHVLVNEGGHGFYRVRYSPALRRSLIETGLDTLAPIERFNLVGDLWATTLAGLTPLSDYLHLTTHFSQEQDKNVWAVLLDSVVFLNRLVTPHERPALQAWVRSLVKPMASRLGWTPAAGEHDLIRQLRGELIGALGKLGNDRTTQEQTLEHYDRYRRDPSSVDPNLLPAMVAILAHTGDDARYDTFIERSRAAKTPQEERRYLFSLAGFQSPDLLQRTLARTISGETRTQDAPFLVSAVLGNMAGREQAWAFIKTNWAQMDRLFPKQGLRRMCGGIVCLATPELEQDVRRFFTSQQIDLGGKTLEQYLEQLRIAVLVRNRELATLRTHLQAVAPEDTSNG